MAARITNCCSRRRRASECRDEFEGLALTRIGTMRKGLAGAVEMDGAPLPPLGYDHLRTLMNLPNPQPVLELIEAFRRSKTMFAAVSMGVFDALHEAPASAAELAASSARTRTRWVGCWMAARRSDCCASSGGVYENDPVAETYLYVGSAHSLRGYVRYSDAALYGMWGHLEDAVREGTHRWTQSFGLEGPIFSAFFRTDEAMRDFLMGMHGLRHADLAASSRAPST